MSDAVASSKKKRKYRTDGAAWAKRSIDGPGVWVTCVKGREKQAVGEMYDLFESVADELWPPEHLTERDDIDDGSDNGLSIEDQIKQELMAIKRPRKEQRFENCHTNTPCTVFISCKKPVDPVRLVEHHIQAVNSTGITRTRNIQRLVPVSASCTTTIPAMQRLCTSVIEQFFSRTPDKHYTFKIDLRVRNHTTLTRPQMIECIAACVPVGHTVELTNPQVFILVEVFKSVCGISVTENYYDLLKFNVMELAARHQELIDASAKTEDVE